MIATRAAARGVMRERTVVSLRYGAELNASEIATTIGGEAAAIRKTLERARTRLGERIDELLKRSTT